MLISKKISGVAISVLAVGLIAGCSSPAPSTDTASDVGTLTPGELSVGLTLAYAPYSYVQDGKKAGFDVEALELVAKELDVDLKLTDRDFAQAVLDVTNKKFDVTPGLYMTAERAKTLDFVPYFSAGTDIVSTEDGPRPQSAEDLCGLKVSSIKGGAVVEKIRTETNATCEDTGKMEVDLREYPSDPEATQALVSGGVDVQLTESIIAKEVLEKTGGSLVVTNKEQLFPVQVGWGMAKGNPELQKSLTEALERAVDSGEYGKLLDRYGLSTYDPELAREAIEDGS